MRGNRLGKLKLPRYSRRTVLAASAVGAGATAVSLPVLFRSQNETNLIRHILEKNLPGVLYTDADLQRLRDDVVRLEYGGRNKKRAFFLMATSSTVVNPEAVFATGRLAAFYQTLERNVITYFLLGSDFFDVPKPVGATLTYNGYEPACGNRFANFVG